MIHDRTDGKKARYAVVIYTESGNEIYHYNLARQARAQFANEILNDWEAGTVISIYDIVRDVRKAFYKV